MVQRHIVVGANRILFLMYPPTRLCQIYEYAVFVAKIKRYRDSMELKEAIDLAVRECIEENILRDFLEQHRREVCDMCLTEFDEKKYEDVLREEGREEGLAEGLEKGLAKGLVKG